MMAVIVIFCGGHDSTASADLITFAFEAVADSPSSTLPFGAGQTISGSYTFELDTAPTTTPAANTFTFYTDAITNFDITIDGFGTGNGGPGGDILLGDPVQTSGSFNFLSDKYVVNSAVSGITVFSSFYNANRNLVGAQLSLQDLDQQGLDSEDLVATPPDLTFFLDNTGPNFDSDHAILNLSFSTPGGGAGSTSFRLTSLTAVSPVPEPNTTAMLLLCAGCSVLRTAHRRRTSG
ncbi:hypothetical protein [Fuerstiella marisgermanici]|uniref:hypothetical protein n=1 Tax=Fuerstiella marisgermanici TaxID=1891926 RepID=UPI0011AB6A75|nr:hypothetical protein [Fuerstiella marisgermanici]